MKPVLQAVFWSTLLLQTDCAGQPALERDSAEASRPHALPPRAKALHYVRSDGSPEVLRRRRVHPAGWARSITIAYVERGPLGGPPLVLLHGDGQDLGAWRELQPRLAQAGFRTIAIDLPGFGLSGDEPAREVDAASSAAAVAALLMELGIRDPPVLGVGIGARVAGALVNAEETPPGLTLVKPETGQVLRLDRTACEYRADPKCAGRISHEIVEALAAERAGSPEDGASVDGP